MLFITECLLLYVLWQAVKAPTSAWEDCLRWVTLRQKPAQIAVAALPEAKPAPRRRTRKAAA